MSHDTDDHPACRNCCRAAGDTSAPCRKAALLALAPAPAGEPPSGPAPEEGSRPGDPAGRAVAAAPVP